MRFQYKTIRTQGKVFIRRFALYNKDGSSYKLHLILNDDLDEPHDHPWDFSSLILFGGYYEGDTLYGAGDVNIKLHHQKHKTRLRTFLGFKVPTITFGVYTAKLQLCSFCREAGHCLSKSK